MIGRSFFIETVRDRLDTYPFLSVSHPMAPASIDSEPFVGSEPEASDRSVAVVGIDNFRPVLQDGPSRARRRSTLAESLLALRIPDLPCAQEHRSSNWDPILSMTLRT